MCVCVCVCVFLTLQQDSRYTTQKNQIMNHYFQFHVVFTFNRLENLIRLVHTI